MTEHYRGVTSSVLTNAAALDSISRFVGNVGVPAAIAFFILSQLNPRLDTIATNQAAANTTLTLIAATCAPGRPVIGDLRSDKP